MFVLGLVGIVAVVAGIHLCGSRNAPLDVAIGCCALLAGFAGIAVAAGGIFL